MKHLFYPLFLLAFSFAIFSCEEGSVKLNNGTYKGSSQSHYTMEPYVGTAVIEIENHKIVSVDFQIVDTLNNEVFGSDYEKHYPDNELYQQQCRENWQGVINYPKQLLEKQNIDSIDAVSGATWSYNIFKASVKEALKE